MRNLGRPETLRDAYRKNPEEMILALILLTGVAGAGLYAVYLYFNYFYHRQFTRYPEPVAKAMRRALYYSNYNPDPQRALKYYKQALDLCIELGLDPFSDDVMGIKIQLAAWLEQIENHAVAAQVLESLLNDCKRWVEVMEKSVRDGTAPKFVSPPPKVDPEGSDQAAAGAPPPETLWGKRTRILGKAVGISIKLGELYSNEHVMQQDRAHERLIWSVETALKEARRRSVEGLKEGEGEWMGSEAIGGALESLAHSYESKSQFHLAVPLFLQALRLCKEPCHSAVIMNNLASSFAQHPTQAPFQTVATAALIEDLPSPESVSASDARKAYLETARRWATNANVHATEPQGEQRTAECDEACAASLCNLGDIAALLGEPDEARRMFERCIAMSKDLGFAAGVKQAEAGLRNLTNPKPKTKSKSK
ncbi:tpr domain-containing protein [Coniochaeta sp. 2T2.1]|nr:tpr domain-containing protein [Coniochaeta sp. 2T2.1]